MCDQKLQERQEHHQTSFVKKAHEGNSRPTKQGNVSTAAEIPFFEQKNSARSHASSLTILVQMKVRAYLREWLGDEWGKMLIIFLMPATMPVLMTFGGEYVLSAELAAILVAPFLAYVLARHHWGPQAVHNVLETSLARLFVGGIGIFGLYNAFEKWYPHTSPTLVYTNGNWMEGERRNCSLNPAAKPYELDCTVKDTQSEPHQFDVSYTGADPAGLTQTSIHSWLCTRGAESISCKDVQ